jgi:hypothetical protein
MTSYMDTGQWRVWEALQRFLKMHGEFWKIKAAGGRRSALDWIWFRRPFHSDCEYGDMRSTTRNDNVVFFQWGPFNAIEHCWWGRSRK